MRKLFVMICLLVLVTPVIAFGASGSIEGTIEGYNCVMQGKTCPIGSEDPLVLTEFTFVVLTPGNKFYFVPNVDRALLARHVAEPVRVTGDISNNAIKAKTIEAKKDGKWKLIFDESFFLSPYKP